MRSITIGVFFSTILLVGCLGSKKSKPVPVQPPAQQQAPTFTPPEEKAVFVPFTREMYDRLIDEGIDIKKVQFFIDQKIVLSRYLDSAKTLVSAGIIKMSKGKIVNEIVIPAYTPGVCEVIEDDGLRISFDRQGGSIKFLNDETYSPKFFIFTGTNWNNGTAEVEYAEKTYRASCANCGSVAEAKLVVKQSEMDKMDKKTRTLTGRKVDSGNGNK